MKKTIIFLLFIILPPLFLIIYPFFPLFKYYLQKPDFKSTLYSFESKSNSFSNIENTLFIPKIGVRAKIIEGSSDLALNKGAWLLPGSGSPMEGNMVIGGHRFMYLPPNNTTFYNLDKLNPNDKIYLVWNHKIYEYKVTKVFTVSPTDTTIENQTKKPILTLFTCTPLWTSSMRLVVLSKRV